MKDMGKSCGNCRIHPRVRCRFVGRPFTAATYGKGVHWLLDVTVGVSVLPSILSLVVPSGEPRAREVDGVTGRPMEGGRPGLRVLIALVLVLVYSRLGGVHTRQSPECLMTPGILITVRMVRHFTGSHNHASRPPGGFSQQCDTLGLEPCRTGRLSNVPG